MALEQPSSLFASKYSLPNELWILVWRNLPQRDRWMASGVCQTWRSLATNTPSLWTDIEIRCSYLEHRGNCVDGFCKTPRTCSNLGAVEQMLLRSGDLGLQVTVNVCQFNGYDHSTMRKMVAQALFLHTHRIVTLHLDSDCPRELDDFITALATLAKLQTLSFIHAQAIPGPVFLQPSKLPAIKTLDLGNACFITDSTYYFRSLRSLATCVTTSDYIATILECAPQLEILTLHDLHFAHGISSNFDAVVARRLARLRELHLTGVTPELEELFSSAMDHAVYDFMSVHFTKSSTSKFPMLDAISDPTHVDARFAPLADGLHVAIVVRDAEQRRSRLVVLHERDIRTALPTLWSRLRNKTALRLTLTLPIPLWIAFRMLNFTASGVTTLKLLLNKGNALDFVIDSEPQLLGLPDLQHVIIEAHTDEVVHIDSEPQLLGLPDLQHVIIEAHTDEVVHISSFTLSITIRTLKAPLPLRSVTLRGLSSSSGLGSLSNLATVAEQEGRPVEMNPADPLIASFLLGQSWRQP